MTMIGQVPPPDIGSMSGKGEGKAPQFGRWWMNWFNQAYSILFALQSSGTTANRPTKNLWIGRWYFDTSLSKPIWLKSVNPSVWIDATGATV